MHAIATRNALRISSPIATASKPASQRMSHWDITKSRTRFHEVLYVERHHKICALRDLIINRSFAQRATGPGSLANPNSKFKLIGKSKRLYVALNNSPPQIHETSPAV